MLGLAGNLQLGGFIIQLVAHVSSYDTKAHDGGESCRHLEAESIISHQIGCSFVKSDAGRCCVGASLAIDVGYVSAFLKDSPLFAST